MLFYVFVINVIKFDELIIPMWYIILRNVFLLDFSSWYVLNVSDLTFNEQIYRYDAIV